MLKATFDFSGARVLVTGGPMGSAWQSPARSRRGGRRDHHRDPPGPEITTTISRAAPTGSAAWRPTEIARWRPHWRPRRFVNNAGQNLPGDGTNTSRSVRGGRVGQPVSAFRLSTACRKLLTAASDGGASVVNGVDGQLLRGRDGPGLWAAKRARTAHQDAGRQLGGPTGSGSTR